MIKSKKLLAVTRHEYRTIVKQPSFWISLIAAPAIFLLIFGINYLSSRSNTDLEKQKNEAGYKISVVDQSGLISNDVTDAVNIAIANDGQTDQLREQVRQDEIDGLIVYPADITKTNSYQVYISTDKEDSDKSSTISGIGHFVLQQSLLAPLGSDEVANLALNGAEPQTVEYEDGQEVPGFEAYVVPGVFMILFYFSLFMGIGYAATSVSEEKENRAFEMVLSYVRPRTLMSGKLIGTTLVTLTQIALYAAIAVIAYFIYRALGNELQLPVNLGELEFAIIPILFGAAYFVTSFLFYLALMLATGAAFPSSKEANSFTAVFYLLAFVPFWGFDAISNTPDSLLSQASTFFPLTAPTTLLLRNTLGNLSIIEAAIGLAILIASTVAAVWLAGKLFKLGALQYNSRVKLADIFKSSSK